MATPAGLQALLELSDEAFSAVVEDRRRALDEARARVEAAGVRFPPEGGAHAQHGAVEAAQQRVEEASLALDMRNAILRTQIARLEGLL